VAVWRSSASLNCRRASSNSRLSAAALLFPPSERRGRGARDGFDRRDRGAAHARFLRLMAMNFAPRRRYFAQKPMSHQQAARRRADRRRIPRDVARAPHLSTGNANATLAY